MRGVFVRSEDTARPAQLLMVPRTQTPFAIVAPGMTKPDGSFDIAGVAPGSYLLYSQDATAVQPIEVDDTDVDNVTLTQALGISLKGHLTFDHGLSAAPGVVSVNASEFQIQMTREPYLVGAP